MKHLILIAALCGFTLNTSAQVSFGPEIGLNAANLKVEYPKINYDNRLKGGLRAGLVLIFRAERGFSIQSGLCYYAKGSNIFASQGSNYFASNLLIHALQVPLYLNLQSSSGPYGRFFIGAGPFADYALSGNERVGPTETSLKIGGEYKDDIKRNDYGIGFQGGYTVNNGLMFKVQYQYGLTNMSPIANQKIESRSMAITIAYMGVQENKKRSKFMKAPEQ